MHRNPLQILTGFCAVPVVPAGKLANRFVRCLSASAGPDLARYSLRRDSAGTTPAVRRAECPWPDNRDGFPVAPAVRRAPRHDAIRQYSMVAARSSDRMFYAFRMQYSPAAGRVGWRLRAWHRNGAGPMLSRGVSGMSRQAIPGSLRHVVMCGQLYICMCASITCMYSLYVWKHNVVVICMCLSITICQLCRC